MPARDPRIDAYIANAAEFARPILAPLRDVVLAACPDVEETIKWGMPHFMHHGLLAGMAAFKAHATFGLWRGKELVPDGDDSAMGQFGCLASVRDLPPKRTLVALVKKAAVLNAAGAPRPRRVVAKKAAPVPSPAFAAALKGNREAARHFAAFAPGQQREYVEWIDEARREDTRTRRIAQALEWIAEGKLRNWKYANC